jgi:DtxR family Mn-dependent transcriptional regulator
MPTRSTVRENYLKTIFELQEVHEQELVSVGQIARALNLTAGTVTGMIKKLASEELLEHQAYAGCRLTKNGRAKAVEILRRHRILELFLVQSLGLDWSDVHEEAERLEHAISDRVLDRIDKMLGYPELDPHGDPIPTADGKIAKLSLARLSDCRMGDECLIARILDESKEFLRFIGTMGLYPGTQIVVEMIKPEAGIIQVKPANGEATSLGLGPAEKLLVEYTR